MVFLTQAALSDIRIPRGVPNEILRSLASGIMDLGLREIPPGSNRSPINKDTGRGIDRYQPARLVGKGSPSRLPDMAWCSAAADTWWHDGFGRYILTTPSMPDGKLERGSDKAKDIAKAMGIWIHAGSESPQPGDSFVLIHGVDTPGFNKGHRGMVLRVSEDGKTIQTIEGNARNAVRLIQRSVPGIGETPKPEQVLGYIRPMGTFTGWEKGLLTTGYESPNGSTR